MTKNAAYYIKKLCLTHHVEGGAFVETYRSADKISRTNLAETFHGDRNYGTAIYFLLAHGDFSAFHKIASDEIWHFYEGDTLNIYELESNGHLIHHKLGRNLEAGEVYQCVIEAGNWFASRCETENGFSLVGCTVAPGFDFEDFELANKESLTQEFPQHQEIIKELCR